MDVEMETFLDFAPLLTLYLTLSASHFHLSSPSHLRQHFCLSMNIWMRLKHWYTCVRAHSVAPSSPACSAHTTPGHKHFIDTLLVKSNVRWLFTNFIIVNSLRVRKISADAIKFALEKKKFSTKLPNITVEWNQPHDVRALHSGDTLCDSLP